MEAYRGASTIWKRYDFSRLGAIQPPEDRSLNEFGDPEGILFRVKVAAADDESAGRLLAEADKIRHKELLQEHIGGLGSLQRLLYASDQYALLLIFQGMDAAGKDGAISHVMSGVNPQGCEVFSFKQPMTTSFVGRCGTNANLRSFTVYLPSLGEMNV